MLVVHCIFKMRCTAISPELQYHALWVRIFSSAMQFYHYDFEQLRNNLSLCV
jgi:hypothetical protein